MRYNLCMNRYVRIGLIVGALVLLAAGSALAGMNPRAIEHRSPVAASHDPEPSEAAKSKNPEPKESAEPKDESTGAVPSAAELDRLVKQLETAGISASPTTLSPLIAKYGVGGAVRVLSFADASGKTAAEIEKMRDDGLGWGQIAQQLNAGGSLNLKPGIGWIMSGGHGNGHAGASANAKGKAGSH